jgi:hypothetical protein
MEDAQDHGNYHEVVGVPFVVHHFLGTDSKIEKLLLVLVPNHHLLIVFPNGLHVPRKSLHHWDWVFETSHRGLEECAHSSDPRSIDQLYQQLQPH